MGAFHPAGMKACSRRLSEAIPPENEHIKTLRTLEGCHLDPNSVVVAPLPGCFRLMTSLPGGVALLNHRLQALMPSASEIHWNSNNADRADCIGSQEARAWSSESAAKAIGTTSHCLGARQCLGLGSTKRTGFISYPPCGLAPE